jgi:hypothetical protein
MITQFKKIKNNDTFVFFTAITLMFAFPIISLVYIGLLFTFLSSIVLFTFGFIEYTVVSNVFFDIIAIGGSVVTANIILYLIDSKLLDYNLSKMFDN